MTWQPPPTPAAELLRGAETALVALRSIKEDWRGSCLATAPEGGRQRARHCTRDLGHDGRHRFEEPDDEDARQIHGVLESRRQAAKKAPKAETPWTPPPWPRRWHQTPKSGTRWPSAASDRPTSRAGSGGPGRRSPARAADGR